MSFEITTNEKSKVTNLGVAFDTWVQDKSTDTKEKTRQLNDRIVEAADIFHPKTIHGVHSVCVSIEDVDEQREKISFTGNVFENT